MQKTDWFLHDRFGMFIHWGVYSIPARGEWVRSNEHMSMESYQPYVDSFSPSHFDPSKWARLAKKAGMKYAVLTAKHHDGYCMFDTSTTEYKITNSAYGKDAVKEFLEAFRAEGLKVGLYYSLLDWSHPDYPHFGDAHHPMRENEEYRNKVHNFENYLSYMHCQIKELLTNYGKLDIMWFDFSYDDMRGEKWGASKILDMLHTYQPQAIIDDRMDGSGELASTILDAKPSFYAGDFAAAEQIVPPGGLVNVLGQSVPWESCITMNQHWGYCAEDHNFKSSELLIHSLVECVSKNGNFLLNVGPDSEGRIPEESVKVLEEIGQWMDVNSSSIYGCGASSFSKPEWGRYTQNGKTLYAHVFEPASGPICLKDMEGKVSSIRILKTGETMESSDYWTVSRYAKGNAFFFTNPSQWCSYPLPDRKDTVVEITLK